jgi:Ferritin-like
MLLIKPQLVANLNSIDGLRTAIQSAIELEHATIPPYLYALYSLGADNTEIAELIHSVVVEEMAHFTLAANVLNAIGGAPCIDKPGFIPAYPGPLPGTVQGGLVVTLERFSIPQTENVFMMIEEPEDPVPIKAGRTAAGQPVTIGVFYGRIRRSIEELETRQLRRGRTIFTGDPAYQVTQDFPSWEIFPVLKLDDAKKAIDFIVVQGEGTRYSPSDPLAWGELAHYYRFSEIVHGRALVSDGKVPPSWTYTGDRIPFDPSKVAPVPANPKTANYHAGSAARYGCETFNYTYTSLLKVLHEAFNGNPSRLSAAIGMMESLKEQALTLAGINSGRGGKAGPSFEYQPTNP